MTSAVGSAGRPATRDDASSGTRPLRIGLLSTSYPSSAADTAGLFVEGFAETLARLGHEVTVLAPALDRPPNVRAAASSAPARDDLAGVSVRRLRYAYPAGLQRTFHRAGAPENLRADPLAALGAVTYPLVLGAHVAALRRSVDVLVSHWAVPSGLVAARGPSWPALSAGARAGRSTPRRVVITHGADIHMLERMPLGGLLARYIASHSDALTFVSRGHQRRFEALVGAPLSHASVLAMGIPTPAPGAPPGDREALRRQLGVSGHVVLTLGRLVPIKGLDALIDALRGVPRVCLVVAGDGPERAALAHKAQQAGVRAHFIGVVLGAQKARWLQAADAFALPSRRLPSGREEGTPTALLEAMLAGLPVVATDTGGVRELLRGGAPGADLGALVPADDVDALRAALRAALDAGAATRARALRAREAARAQTWDALAPRIDDLMRGR